MNCFRCPLRRFDGQEKVLAGKESPEDGQMPMFDYDLGRVVALLRSLGFLHFWIEHTDHAGVHGAWIFARRAHVMS